MKTATIFDMGNLQQGEMALLHKLNKANGAGTEEKLKEEIQTPVKVSSSLSPNL